MAAVSLTTPATRQFLLAAILVALHGSAAAEPPVASPPAADETQKHEYFERSVRPLLVQHCYSCHGKGQAKGGLNLADRKGLLAGGESGAVVSLERPAESPLIAAVEGRDGLQMPPNAKLAESEVAVLRRWVEMGAPWPEKNPADGTPGSVADENRRSFWAFQPVTLPKNPAVRDTSWVRQPIDRFVLARLEAEGLRPVDAADRRTFLRRAAFDLTGLPPHPDEVAAFIADGQPDAYERVIDRLLASPQYGERWARYWLDVARYGEDQAHTFQARQYPNGFRYRDWVVESFNADMPYDQFVMAQIAGDLLPDGADPKERSVPLGYFALGPVYYKDAGCAGKAESDEYDDRIDTLGRGFLGLTVSCARCHDHKFDPIPTADYYALAGVFASTEYREVPLVPEDVVKQYDKSVADAAEREKALKDAREKAVRDIAEKFASEAGRAIVAVWKISPAGRRPSGEEWDRIAAETGLPRVLLERWGEFLKSDVVGKRPFLKALNDTLRSPSSAEAAPNAEAVAAVEQAALGVQQQLLAALEARRKAIDSGEKKPKLEPAQDEVLKTLLTDGSAPLAIPKDQAEKLFTDETKASLAARQKEVEEARKAVGPKYPFAHSLADGAPKNLKVHVRGNHKELGDEAPRRFLSVLSRTGGDATPFQHGSGRLELARAIASPTNPLTARVMVNRIWQWHFGRGLVGTPSNFGLLGERPTHPELLDHLAARFMASGWSVKQLHREIMLSATYRLGSDSRGDGASEGAARDPENRLLWRQNRRRLEIEPWRDAMLAAGGRLDDRLGGAAASLNDTGNRRRTLYAAISRHDLNGTLRLFDFPDPNLTSERRVSTTVPMQQLFVLNSEFLAQQARALAQRIEREAPADDAARIEYAYSVLFQRKPTATESRIGLAYLAAPLPVTTGAPNVKLAPWERYAQVLLGTNEFAFID